MKNIEIINKYYEYANAGNWDAWCDLFGENQIMNEQLAGHIEGLTALRSIMSGMDKTFSTFYNIPKKIIVSGNEGAVVSHISATNLTEESIEADVMNYFYFHNGKILYMANFHDTKPFAPIFNQ